MRDLLDDYGIKARLFPALLCVPPYLLVGHVAFERLLDPTVTQGLFLAIGDVSLTVVLLYLLMQLNRRVSKALFQNDLQLPTVLMLLPSDTKLSAELKAKLAGRILRDFSLPLPTSADELADPTSARIRISDICSLMRSKVGAGALLLQHNTEYGFARNLVGGAALALVVSALGAVVFLAVMPNRAALTVSIVLGALYLLPLVFRRVLLEQPGEDYARVLFREYLGT